MIEMFVVIMLMILTITMLFKVITDAIFDFKYRKHIETIADEMVKEILKEEK